jgi:RNA polymerase sigma-70 factor, ECF subfamily
VNYLDLSPAELFSICTQGSDAASWEEFIRRFNPVIARSVLRVTLRHGPSDKSLVDDLIQETYLKICANGCNLLRTFSPTHPDSAFGFLKVVAASVAQDHFKSRLASKRAPEATASSVDRIATPDPTEYPGSQLSRTERGVLIGQIDRKLKAVLPPEESQRSLTVFWLYYRSGLTASAIASLPSLNLTTKGVESMLFRMTRIVRENLCQTSGATPDDKKGFRQAESF